MTSVFEAQKVYELLRTVPRGRVVTYGQLAEMLGNRAWARAVGNALHDNPDGDRYPCYKVVNSRGELSRAYAFGGIDGQTRRLEAEGITVVNGKVELNVYRMDIPDKIAQIDQKPEYSLKREVINSCPSKSSAKT